MMSDETLVDQSADFDNEQVPLEDAVAGMDAPQDQGPSNEAAPFDGAMDVGTEQESGEEAAPLDDQLRRYEEELAQERARAERLEARQAELDQREREIKQRQAREQWEQLQKRAEQHASTLGFDEAMDFMRDFYRQQNDATLQAAQEMTQQVYAQQYRAHVIEQYGLSQDDAALLGNDPYRFDEVAKSLKNRTSSTSKEIEALRKELDQLRRGQQAQKRIQSGVDRTGGIGGQPLPNDLSQLSEKDHLRALMQQGGLL